MEAAAVKASLGRLQTRIGSTSTSCILSRIRSTPIEKHCALLNDLFRQGKVRLYRMLQSALLGRMVEAKWGSARVTP